MGDMEECGVEKGVRPHIRELIEFSDTRSFCHPNRPVTYASVSLSLGRVKRSADSRHFFAFV